MDSLTAFYQNACVAEGVETNSALVKLFLQLESGIVPPTPMAVVERKGSKMGMMGGHPLASHNRTGPLGEMPAAEVANKVATSETGSGRGSTTQGVSTSSAAPIPVSSSAQSRTSALTELDFSNHYLGGKSIAALCRTLTTLRMLRTVSFRSVGLDEVAHAAIVQWATSHPSIQNLDVSSNPCFASSGRLYTGMLEKNPRIVVFRVDYDDLPDRIASKLKIVLGRNIARAFPVTEKSGSWGHHSLEPQASDSHGEGTKGDDIWSRWPQLSQEEKQCLEEVVAEKELFLSWYTRFGLWTCQLVSDFGMEGLRLLRSYNVAHHAAICTRDRSTEHALWPASIRRNTSRRGSSEEALEMESAAAVSNLIEGTLKPFRAESWTPSLGQLLLANSTSQLSASVVSEESQAVLQVQLQHLRSLSETIIQDIQQRQEPTEDGAKLLTSNQDALESCTAAITQFMELLQHVKRRLGMCAVDMKAQSSSNADEPSGLLAIQLECDAMEKHVIDDLFIQKRTLRLLKDEAQYLAQEYPTAFAKSKVRIFSVPVAPPPPPTPTVDVNQGRTSRTPTERSSPSSILSKPNTPTQDPVFTPPSAAENVGAPIPRPPTGQRSQPATSFRAERVVQHSSGVPALEVQRRYAMCEVPLRIELGDALDEVLVSLRLGDSENSSGTFGYKRRALLRRALTILPPRLSAFLLGLHWERCYAKRKTLSALEGYRSASLSPTALLDQWRKSVSGNHKSSAADGEDAGELERRQRLVQKYMEGLSELVGRLLAGPTSVQFLGTEVVEEGDPLRILASASFCDEKQLSLFCQQSAAWWRLRELLLVSQ